MNINTVGIVGAGQMGSGIAQICAAAGLNVVLNDINDAAVQRGIASISGNLDRMVSKDKLSAADAKAMLGRIKGTTALADLGGSDFLIEAATENLSIKQEILKNLDKVAKADSIQTSDATYKATDELAKRIGKTPITVKNSPGFVVNRILVPMINEAIFVFQEGLASAEEIDAGMKLGANHPIGPLALADLIGLDVCLAVMEVFYRDFNDSKYRPAPLLREMVDAGYLGRKTKKGFYNY
jgi:3-hydroxybutyryl-CoA dehydrogenase